jgi:hypothetical protein
MKVYVTKYALTKGIIVKEVEKTAFNDTVVTKGPNFQHFYNNDWFENRKDAVKEAEKMRLKKIASLEKQIDKLHNLKF